MSVGYPVRAGGRVEGTVGGAVGNSTAQPFPPPAPRVGDAVTVHLASCESPEQHERVTLAGRVVERYMDGAVLAEFSDGSRMELCPWFTSDCPNAKPVEREQAA